jgi:glycosyltransferase involved in cell wall biosynthesis
MFSICIPIYNHDVRSLILALKEQAEQLNVEYEILLIDDCSTNGCPLVNKELTIVSRIRYIELHENIGRAAIRNRLAKEATYRYLVFMDCDAQLIVPKYISNYLKICTPGIVCYGGKRDLPACTNPQCYLRWLYGSIREDASPEQRLLKPYSSFRAFNFLIDKELFQKVSFDETLKTYGHEDTMFGLMLEAQNIEILHIDNPLLYSGYDTSREFIRKTEEGIRNLVRLQKTPYGSRLTVSNKLLRTAQRLHAFHLNVLYIYFFRIFRKPILANLKSTHASLFIFDLYKLGKLLEDSVYVKNSVYVKTFM